MNTKIKSDMKVEEIVERYYKCTHCNSEHDSSEEAASCYDSHFTNMTCPLCGFKTVMLDDETQNKEGELVEINTFEVENGRLSVFICKKCLDKLVQGAVE